MPIKTSFFGYVRAFDLNGENKTRGTIKATLVILK